MRKISNCCDRVKFSIYSKLYGSLGKIVSVYMQSSENTSFLFGRVSQEKQRVFTGYRCSEICHYYTVTGI